MNKKTLVLGASLKEDRYSNMAIKKLIKNNHEVLAVGIRKGKADNINIETGNPPFKDVDTITLYISLNRQKENYEYIVSLEPKRVIFNPGTENDELVELLEQNNIEVEVACTLVLLTINQF